MVAQWKEISKERVFDSPWGRGVEKVVFVSEETGEEQTFHLYNQSDGADVLALTKDNEVILVRQFRPGPGKIVYELPAGRIEKGEDDTAAIVRELREETGYVGDVQFVAKMYRSVYTRAQRHCFVATNCTKVSAQHLDEYEDIDVVIVSLDVFRMMLAKGDIMNTDASYLGLEYLGLL